MQSLKQAPRALYSETSVAKEVICRFSEADYLATTTKLLASCLETLLLKHWLGMKIPLLSVFDVHRFGSSQIGYWSRHRSDGESIHWKGCYLPVRIECIYLAKLTFYPVVEKKSDGIFFYTHPKVSSFSLFRKQPRQVIYFASDLSFFSFPFYQLLCIFMIFCWQVFLLHLKICTKKQK